MHFCGASILAGLASISAAMLPANLALAVPQSILQHAQIPAIAQKIPVGKVGQVSPNQPIRMVIQNSTPIALFAGISGGTRVELPKGASNAFVFDSTPVNVFVYPAGQGATLKYKTTVNGNTVTVQVTQMGGETPGDGAININPAGVVSIY